MGFDSFREECGVVGVFGHPEAAKLTYLALYQLQHRGQEGAGIVSSSGNTLHSHRSLGLVADVFDEDVLGQLTGAMAIGHVRYSTAGQSLLKNVQPLVKDYKHGGIATAHNGNLTNALRLRHDLEDTGAMFQSTSDTEVIVHLLARSREERFIDRVADALRVVQGAFSILFLSETEMVAARDPRGFRPLILGRLGSATIVASESCALDLLDADYVREIEPGELLHVTPDGIESYFPWPKAQHMPCVFEYIYFARPDSLVYGENVYKIRKELGKRLARERGVDADLVIPVPDSGTPAAMGYAEEADLPLEMGLIRNHYVGRTFIEPEDTIRNFGVKLKLNALPTVLQGKRVILVDDSIVRGTTSRKIVKMVRAAGAKEVHLRISSPPTTHPCYYGVDTPTRAELIAATHTEEDIARHVTADSIGYLSIEGMLQAAGRRQFCKACFDGKYPIRVMPNKNAEQYELFEGEATLRDPVTHIDEIRRRRVV